MVYLDIVNRVLFSTICVHSSRVLMCICAVCILWVCALARQLNKQPSIEHQMLAYNHLILRKCIPHQDRFLLFGLCLSSRACIWSRPLLLTTPTPTPIRFITSIYLSSSIHTTNDHVDGICWCWPIYSALLIRCLSSHCSYFKRWFPLDRRPYRYNNNQTIFVDLCWGCCVRACFCGDEILANRSSLFEIVFPFFENNKTKLVFKFN